MEPLEVVRGWLRWLEASGTAAHTRENYTRPVTRFLMACDFQTARLDDLVAFSLTQPTRSAHITYAGLRSFFGYAVHVGARPDDPTAFLQCRPQARTVPVAFTPDDMDRLRVAAARLDPRYPAAIDFLYSTGARIGEAVAVTDADVSETGVLLRKTKARPGGLRQERVVPLGPRGRDAIATLQDLRRDPATVFGVGHKSVYAWCRESGKAAGIYCRPHLLRSTFATELARRGVDIRTIQELLGHTNITTTSRYVAVDPERKQAAVLLLG
jgi:integrase/recombinase XerD